MWTFSLLRTPAIWLSDSRLGLRRGDDDGDEEDDVDEFQTDEL